MRDRLIGTWKLVSAVREEMSSARVDQLGANAHRIGPFEYEEEQDRWKNKCDVPQLGSLGILIGLKSRIVGSERAGNPSAPNRSGSVLTPRLPVAPTAARSFNSEGQL